MTQAHKSRPKSGADRQVEFALMVVCAPDALLLARNAIEFVKAALATGHRIGCVFFYQQGAATGLRNMVCSTDDYDVQAQWQRLAVAHQLDLAICVGSAQRRGISDADGSVAEGFRVTGLGRWLEAMAAADRVVRFG